MIYYDEKKKMLYIPEKDDRIYRDASEVYNEAFNRGYGEGYSQGVSDAEEECHPDYSKKYFTIEMLSSGALFPGGYVEYRLNGGEWSAFNPDNLVAINVAPGDVFEFRCTDTEVSGLFQTYNSGSIEYGVHATCKTYGNVMSLFYGDDFMDKTAFPENISYYACTALFKNCTSLVDASGLVLPALVAIDQSYRQMFYYCTNLVYPPALPATTVKRACYVEMFRGCSSMISAPVLPAKTVPSGAYGRMFYSCIKLDKIVCFATEIEEKAAYNWLEEVPAGGTFVKPTEMNDWPSGTSGIPDGWTVVDVE